jgi:hypothetical protein
MPKTYSQQLEEVQIAIGKIESGAQSYTIGEGGATRTVTRATLRDLYDREVFLRRMADREANGGGMRVNYGMPE